MSPRILLAPLTSGTTWRRWAYLILGGAVFWPYVVAGLVLSVVAQQRLHSTALAVVVATFCIVALPVLTAFMPVIRQLEGGAARMLLGGPVAEHKVGRATTWPDRFRTAGWFYAHLTFGGVVCMLTMMVPTGALGLILTTITGDPPSLGIAQLAPLDVLRGPVAPVIAVVVLVALVYAVAALGEITSIFAPALLGPSTAEWQAELERRTERLAERNRLARELHDSVGHSLSVVTLQAGAAARVLDADPAFARQALSAIEESARTALADLDHVLGVLREDPESATPRPTLDAVDELLRSTRLTGLKVRADVPSDLSRVPSVVSREAYRIVQEGLTNALRHAGKVPVELHVRVGTDELELEMTNPLTPGHRPGRDDGEAGSGRGGRGLPGMRERVTVLRGTMIAGPDDGHWTVAVRLPIKARR